MSFASGSCFILTCYETVHRTVSVSYTHLDVYKRQPLHRYKILKESLKKAEISVASNMVAGIVCFLLYFIRPQNVWVYVCLLYTSGAGLRWRPLHKVQKHRPNRQGKRWVQLVALGGIEKRAWTQCPSSFWRFLFFVRGSELCEAQETRGSKFIYEFGRNSTVYCFVASENKTAPAHKRQNLPNFLEIYLRCLPFTFCV